MPFHLDSPWDATLIPPTACVTDWGRNRILTVGKNSGPILCCLWTKVHEIFGVSDAFAPLSISLLSCFVQNQKIFAIKSRSRRKTERTKIRKRFWPQFFWDRRPRLFYGRLLARFTLYRLVELCNLTCVYKAMVLKCQLVRSDSLSLAIC